MPTDDVVAQALLRDLAGSRGHVEQRGGGGAHVVAPPVDLVRPLAEHAVEDLQRHRHEIGMRDPGAVEALARLALLVLAHLLERNAVHLRIAARGDERGHAADRVRAAAVARLHEQLRVGTHERHRHRHRRAVRQHELGTVAELLDDAEDVVPAAGVQSGRVLAQLVQDLLHLEGGENRLDEDGRLDRPLRHAQLGPAPTRRRRSRAAPRGGSRAWAGRRSGRRARGCAGSRARSRRGWPRSARRRPRSAARRGASRAAGRGASRSRRSAGTASRPCRGRSCVRARR